MDSAYLVGILTYGHILSAIGWLGSALTMNLVLGPLMGRFSPATRSELLRHFAPRFARMTAAFAGLTVLFGIGLYRTLSPDASMQWTMTLGIGILIALVAFVLGIGVILPASNRLTKAVGPEGTAPIAPPPASFLKDLQTLKIMSAVVMVLLLIVLGFMVDAAQI